MECTNPKYLSKHDINVPCGRCAFCMATRKSDWSSRLYYERKQHVCSSFVTLTYAEPHLRFRSGVSQLSVSDLQKWFKRVRKAGYKFRYFAVGEYGSHTFRPHYHILIFGHVPEDVIRKSWTNGIVHIGKVSVASTSYCLKYVVNSKHRGMRNGRTAPFATMSRKPGLGANYLSQAMIAWHRSGRKNYMLIDGQKVHLPRYYKGKIFSKIDHVRIAVRDSRAAIESLRAKLAKLKIKVSSAYPLGALSYHEEQMQIAATRILSTNRKNLIH